MGILRDSDAAFSTMSLTHLLLQITVILVAARACGLVLRAFGQPMVIGEMAAGLLLGPAVLGALLPQWHGQLFPASSLPALSSLATLGVVLFMFIVGAELRAPSGLGAQLRAAAWVGFASMALPMVLGIAIAPLLHPTLAPAGVALLPFALFLGVALSITAFPVLARILKDRNLTRTRIGQLSLGAAGVVDALAWVLLALVVALASAGAGLEEFARITFGLALMIAVVFLVLRPLLLRLIARSAPDGVPPGTNPGAPRSGRPPRTRSPSRTAGSGRIRHRAARTEVYTSGAGQGCRAAPTRDHEAASGGGESLAAPRVMARRKSASRLAYSASNSSRRGMTTTSNPDPVRTP